MLSNLPEQSTRATNHVMSLCKGQVAAIAAQLSTFAKSYYYYRLPRKGEAGRARVTHRDEGLTARDRSRPGMSMTHNRNNSVGDFKVITKVAIQLRIKPDGE